MNHFFCFFLIIFILFFYMTIYLMYLAESLGLEFLGPQSVLGIFILVTGFIFSLMMFYIGYISIREMYSNKSLSLNDKKMKEQKEKIARLYPQSSWFFTEFYKAIQGNLYYFKNSLILRKKLTFFIALTWYVSTARSSSDESTAST